jgi:hypothetical protein
MTGEHNSPLACHPPSSQCVGMVYHIYIFYSNVKFTVPVQCSNLNSIKTKIPLLQTSVAILFRSFVVLTKKDLSYLAFHSFVF